MNLFLGKERPLPKLPKTEEEWVAFEKRTFVKSEGKIGRYKMIADAIVEGKGYWDGPIYPAPWTADEFVALVRSGKYSDDQIEKMIRDYWKEIDFKLIDGRTGEEIPL